MSRARPATEAPIHVLTSSAWGGAPSWRTRSGARRLEARPATSSQRRASACEAPASSRSSSDGSVGAATGSARQDPPGRSTSHDRLGNSPAGGAATAPLHGLDDPPIGAGGAREQLKLRLMARARRGARPGDHRLGRRAAQLPRPRLGSAGHVVAVHNGIVDGARPGAGRGNPERARGRARRGARRHGDRPPHGQGSRGRRRSGPATRSELSALRLLVLGEGPDRREVEGALAHWAAARHTGPARTAARARRRRRADPPDAGGCVPDRAAGVEDGGRARDRTSVGRIPEIITAARPDSSSTGRRRTALAESLAAAREQTGATGGRPGSASGRAGPRRPAGRRSGRRRRTRS